MNTVINERWDKYRHLLNLTSAPAKTVLLKEGEVSKKAYFWKTGSKNRKWISFNMVKMASDKKRKKWLADLEKRFIELK